MSSFWGIDIGGSTVVLGRLDGAGGFQRVSVIRNSPDREPLAVLEEACGVILSEDDAPAAIGAGVAGLVDRQAGILHFSPNLPAWGDMDVAGVVSRLSGAAVTVDNDCNVFAYGAMSTGLIPSPGTHLMLTLGTGIGGTIVCDGRIIYGTGFAGEFGHMPVQAEGIRCSCGSRGCWEMYAAKSALTRYYSAGGGSAVEPAEIASLARRGEQAAADAFRELGRWLGIGMAGLANCFSPSGFFLAGGLSGSWDLFAGAAEAEYLSRCRHPWEVRILDSPSDAGAAGAAMMARDSLA